MRCLVFLACLVAAACGVEAASFDCAKAATAVEKAICADPGLSQADERMAEAYRQAMAASLAPRTLRTDQIRWLAGRDSGNMLDGLRESYDRRIALLGEEAGKWQSVRRDVSVVAESEDSQNAFCCGRSGRAWTCVRARRRPWGGLVLVTSRCARNLV